jgi:hypothetical protein
MQKKVVDGYIIDTCKSIQTDHTETYTPGAMMYAGRKLMETKQWKDQNFDSQEAANEFVRKQLANKDVREMDHVGDLPAHI